MTMVKSTTIDNSTKCSMIDFVRILLHTRPSTNGLIPHLLSHFLSPITHNDPYLCEGVSVMVMVVVGFPRCHHHHRRTWIEIGIHEFFTVCLHVCVVCYSKTVRFLVSAKITLIEPWNWSRWSVDHSLVSPSSVAMSFVGLSFETIDGFTSNQAWKPILSVWWCWLACFFKP